MSPTLASDRRQIFPSAHVADDAFFLPSETVQCASTSVLFFFLNFLSPVEGCFSPAGRRGAVMKGKRPCPSKRHGLYRGDLHLLDPPTCGKTTRCRASPSSRQVV